MAWEKVGEGSYDVYRKKDDDFGPAGVIGTIVIGIVLLAALRGCSNAKAEVSPRIETPVEEMQPWRSV